MPSSIYRHVAISAVAVSILITTSPLGHGETVVKPGDRVKIKYKKVETEKLLHLVPLYTYSASGSVIGEVISSDCDSLILQSDYDSQPAGFSIDDITLISVSRGRHRAVLSGLWKGAAVGALFGALLAMADPAYKEELVGDSLVPVNQSHNGWAVFGGTLAAGAIIGTTIGYFSVSDDWQIVRIDKLSFDARVRPRINWLDLKLTYLF